MTRRPRLQEWLFDQLDAIYTRCVALLREKRPNTLELRTLVDRVLDDAPFREHANTQEEHERPYILGVPYAMRLLTGMVVISKQFEVEDPRLSKDDFGWILETVVDHDLVRKCGGMEGVYQPLFSSLADALGELSI
jgi:hypothetical protein